jgi:hypothetical protein
MLGHLAPPLQKGELAYIMGELLEASPAVQKFNASIHSWECAEKNQASKEK